MIPDAPQKYNAGQFGDRLDVAVALGEFVSRWSLAEMSLMMPMILATGMSQETASAALYSANSTEAKIGIVKNVVENSLLDDDSKRRIKSALNCLLSLCSQRNSLMHHLWACVPGEDVYTIDYRKSDRQSERHVVRTPEAVSELANRVVEAASGICVAARSSWIPRAGIDALQARAYLAVQARMMAQKA